jgi:hypothetical protein
MLGAMVRRLLLVPIGLVLGVVLYAGAARIGLVPNPFAPVTRGDLLQARSDRPGTRVLFVGNSFTYRNDLPGIVHGLGGGAVSFTAGGWRLHDFAHNRSLERLLDEAHWNYVGFTDGLNPNDARFLQSVAWDTVRAPS